MGMRHVHFSETEIWSWKTGGWRVIIWAPTRSGVRGKRSTVNLSTLWGCEPRDIDWNDDHAITPGAVKAYIEKNRAELT